MCLFVKMFFQSIYILYICIMYAVSAATRSKVLVKDVKFIPHVQYQHDSETINHSPVQSETWPRLQRVSGGLVDSAGRSPSPHCPLCNSRLRFSLLDAPVSIRTPFDNGHAIPYALTIGSMHGPLYISERDNSELHVGITNSKGVVYNYTMKGVRRDETGWEQCVAVRLLQPDAASAMSLWDRELERFALSDTWAPERFYEEREFGTCCYAFALDFINQMRAAGGKQYLTRDEFTAIHILPRMKTISTYVQIYREVLEHGFYMIDRPRDGTG